MTILRALTGIVANSLSDSRKIICIFNQVLKHAKGVCCGHWPKPRKSTQLKPEDKTAMEIDTLPKAIYYQPTNNLKWIVRKFESIKNSSTSLVFSDNFIPRPDFALVFNFKNIPEVVTPENIRLNSLFIATIPVKPLLLSIAGPIDSFIIVCKATVFSRIFKMNMVNTIPIVEITDPNLLQLKDRMLQKSNDTERIEVFSDFLCGLNLSDYEPDIIDVLYDDIIANCINKTLQQILDNRFLSKSSLQRNFLKRTGVSMKKMVRIARIHRILEFMLREKQFDFRSIFSESMYYDQSHFINDFKEITGVSPLKFFKQHTEILRMISGIEHPN